MVDKALIETVGDLASEMAALKMENERLKAGKASEDKWIDTESESDAYVRGWTDGYHNKGWANRAEVARRLELEAKGEEGMTTGKIRDWARYNHPLQVKLREQEKRIAELEAKIARVKKLSVFTAAEAGQDPGWCRADQVREALSGERDAN